MSPFDSLIWDRPRTARVFGFTHRLEAYTPLPRRVHGLRDAVAGRGRLIGRIDPKRDGTTLIARQVSLISPFGAAQVDAAAAALREAATWVGCDSVPWSAAGPRPWGPS